MTCSRHTLSVEWTRWMAVSHPYRHSMDRTAVEAETWSESVRQRALSTERKLWRKSEFKSLTYEWNRLNKFIFPSLPESSRTEWRRSHHTRTISLNQRQWMVFRKPLHTTIKFRPSPQQSPAELEIVNSTLHPFLSKFLLVSNYLANFFHIQEPVWFTHDNI